uniref:Uncharacterized protein n=1 Tax=Syphacia muris TaxID=451379 RepID=A0A158R531_9BILA
MYAECSWSESEDTPLFSNQLRASNSSPENLNAVRLAQYPMAMEPSIFTSPSVIVTVWDGERGSRIRASSRLQESHSLSQIAESPFHRTRTFSNNYTMPAYGPDGRTLIKGATITTTSRPNYGTSKLDKRYGRSCDLSDRQLEDENDKLLHNPIAQVK